MPLDSNFLIILCITLPPIPQVIPQAESLGQLYTQVVDSPSRHFFLLVLFSFVGFIFIFGLLCGRVTRRTIAMKNK